MLKQQPQNHWDYHNHHHRQFHEKTSEINLGAKQKQGQKMIPPPQDVEGHHRHHHDELLYDDDDDSEDVVEDGVLPIGNI